MSLVSTEPGLVLKATPPRLQKSATARPRLSLDSAELADKAVIALQAPAGFGKTQLLAQWRRDWLAQGGVVIWLALDEHDDPLRLAHGLAVAKAVGSGRPVMPQSSTSLFGKGADDLDDLDELTSWLAEIADLGAETLLILDDAHSLPEATARHSLTYLLRNTPANLRVAMASRGRMTLPMADLLAQGYFGVVGVEDLRFTLDETLALLATRFGQRLELDDCAHLHEITEGWPLGLQLTISAIERSSDLHSAIRDLAMSNGNRQNFFIDSLLSRLSQQQTDFLTRISLFEMVHPQLCVVLLADERAAAWLQELLSSTPILIEGVDSDWLRIHPLAQELLRSRFAALPEAERQLLHQRAAEWLAGHGLPEAAARQALLAGQTRQAYALAESCLYELMLRGHFTRTLDWIEQLPSHEVERCPRLRLVVAWSLALSGHQTQAVQMIEQVGSDPNASAEEQCEAAAILSTAAFSADHPDSSQQIIEPWLDKAPAFSIKLQAILANHRIRLALAAGHTERARHYCQNAPRFEWTSGMDAVRGHRDWQFGLSYFWEGQMLSAERALRASLSQADQDIGRRSGIALLMATTLANVLLERDAQIEASTVLANRLDLLARLAAPEAIVQGYVSAARLAALQGQTHRAHDLLDELFAIGETRQMPRLCISALAEQLRQHALRGHSETCQALWQRLDQLLPDFVREPRGLLGPELALYAQLGHVYACVSSHDWSGVLALLEQAAPLAERLRRGRESVQILLLQALARQRLGEDGVPALREAVSLAEEYGLLRILADTHPDLPAWAAQLQGNAPTAAVQPPAAAPGPPRKHSTVSVSPSRMLTPKEREVLQLLARNMSNKQIALALEVGEETVKWHMKNLFGKFQAGNRKHVLDRAYLLGILQP